MGSLCCSWKDLRLVYKVLIELKIKLYDLPYWFIYYRRFNDATNISACVASVIRTVNEM